MQIGKKTWNIYSQVPEYLRQDRDMVIAITGEEGSGKSTLGLCLSLVANHAFDIDLDILYTVEDITERLKTVGRYQTLLLDEAVEFAFSRNAMKRDQKKVIQTFMQVRQKNLFFILLIPNFSDMDKYFRKWRIKRWLHVKERGTYLSHSPSRNLYSSDIFWEQKYIGHFGRLDGEIWEKYLNRKKRAFEFTTPLEEAGKEEQISVTCIHCGYVWTPRTAQPKSCPKCHKYFI